MIDRDDIAAQRWREMMRDDFIPPKTAIAPDLRQALAAEYSAYQLGQISKKLDRLIELLQRAPDTPE